MHIKKKKQSGTTFLFYLKKIITKSHPFRHSYLKVYSNAFFSLTGYSLFGTCSYILKILVWLIRWIGKLALHSKMYFTEERTRFPQKEPPHRFKTARDS